ncbi:glutathione S-transferase theta-3-like isoform X1 [Vespula squamosa]|uniref:Glutathione S-transferase theta-3-like isoform X1 n=1 Tax=Vespula squamosa TaxID=30214 RepID=A0ABD2C6W3_VESSQ
MRKHAKIDNYLEWQHLNTRINCSLYFAVMLHKSKQIEKYETQMLNCLYLLENIWLKDKFFLISNKIISDAFGAYHLKHLHEFISNPYFYVSHYIPFLHLDYYNSNSLISMLCWKEYNRKLDFIMTKIINY